MTIYTIQVKTKRSIKQAGKRDDLSYFYAIKGLLINRFTNNSIQAEVLRLE